MRVYKVDFEPVYPVGNTLIIAALSKEQAMKIAEETVTHASIDGIKEVDINNPCVIEYMSGDY